MTRLLILTGTLMIALSIPGFARAEDQQLHKKVMILNDETVTLRPEQWRAGSGRITPTQAACLDDLYKTKSSLSEIFKRCKVKESDVFSSKTGAQLIREEAEKIRKDCEDNLFATSKMSGPQIRTLCERKMLEFEKSQGVPEQRSHKGVACESVSEREVVCGGRRYVRDRGSVLDSGNAMKQLIEQFPDSPGAPAGADKGKAVQAK